MANGDGKKKRKIKKGLKRSIRTGESSSARKKMSAKKVETLAKKGRAKAKKQTTYLRPKKN